MWILLFCAAQSMFPPEPQEPHEHCDVMGLFETAEEAVSYGEDYCMGDFHCMAKMRLNEVKNEHSVEHPHKPL